MCRQGLTARRTVGALSCAPNRFRFSGWSGHEDSPFTDISQWAVDLQPAGSGSDAPCTPSCSSPTCRDACRRGAYVRRVRGASSIRHFSVVTGMSFLMLAPHTRYRAFPPPWFRIVTVSRLRGSSCLDLSHAGFRLLAPSRRRILMWASPAGIGPPASSWNSVPSRHIAYIAMARRLATATAALWCPF